MTTTVDELNAAATATANAAANANSAEPINGKSTNGGKAAGGRRVGQELWTVLLYFIGISTFLSGVAGMLENRGMGIGMMVSGLLVLPPARRAGFRITNWHMPTAIRVLSFIIVPVITGTLFMGTNGTSVERTALVAQVAKEKPAIVSRIQVLITNKEYERAMTEADRYDAARDPDITALGKKAQRLRDAQAVAKAAQAASQERANCEADDACLIDNHESAARRQCKPVIEASARYAYEWTDGFGGPKTFSSSYVDRQAGTIRFSGNQLKLQNGFGAWQQYRYECLFNYRTNKVVNAMVNS